MKKSIKKYLAQLQENGKKGFSLVELIIVMAIMAILVGVVASQVIPYMEKSRQSKDQQVMGALLQDLNSAIAQSGEGCKGSANGAGTPEVLNETNLKAATNQKTLDELITLRPEHDGGTTGAADGSDIANLITELKGQMKSKAANATGADIYFQLNGTSGELILFVNTGATIPNNEKMVARSKETAPSSAP